MAQDSLAPVAQAFVVVAEFVVKPGCMDAFMAHALDDASHSLSEEAGCLQFDVLRLSDQPDAVVFYEVYRSQQAFDAHLRTPHVERFRAILTQLVQSERPVRLLARAYP